MRANLTGPVTPTSPRGRRRVGVCVALGVVLPLAGCSGTTRPAAQGHREVGVWLRPAGCGADPASVPAGAVTFRISNHGADRVEELEVLRGDRVLGERERLGPGRSAELTLELTPGTYTLRCPGADRDRVTFTVTPGSPTGGGDRRVEAALRAAVDGYRRYVRGEVDALATATRAFAAAVVAGDVRRARALYVPARTHYERVEPVAESFGTLDADIDAREGDVDPADWRGFHRLERALWTDGSTAGMAPVARRLVADVDRLRVLVADADYQPAQLADGAAELLDEVANSKVTGEEERYSGTDLDDVAANVAGARAAFDLLAPALDRVDAALSGTIRSRFAAVDGVLHRLAAAGSFPPYRRVPVSGVRDLAAAVDALAEPLSQVAARIAAR